MTICALFSGFYLYRIAAVQVSLAQNTGFETPGEVSLNLKESGAVKHSKEKGEYNSLAEAFTAARYKTEKTSEGAAAVNHANQMRAAFTSGGLRLHSNKEGEKWQLGWNLKSFGYGAKQKKVSKGNLRFAGQKVELVRSDSGVTEWFDNTPEGLEHGFILEQRPSENLTGESLQLLLSSEGNLRAETDNKGQTLTLLNEKNEAVLSYDKLKVWDANGAPLASQMRATGGKIVLEVAETNAVYPITIDPTFSRQTKLTASDGSLEDNFGNSVSIFGTTAIVGANKDDSEKGAAYIFVRNGTAWTQQAKLTASDGAAGDLFGTGVAISGETAIVGATRNDVGSNGEQGAAYVFVRSGAAWTQQAKLTASDGAAGDSLGTSVSISGETAVVSAALDDVASNQDQGSAYVFVRSGAAWTQQAKLTASDGVGFDGFGNTVSISGETIVVGSSKNDSAKGAAYVFVRSSAAWTQQAKLTASDGGASEYFGFSVSISGESAIIGAYFDGVGSNIGQGSAFVFVRNGTAWTQQAKLTASDGAADDRFGYAVGISGETVIVGAVYDDTYKGAAYIFVRSGAAWTQLDKLSASDGANNDIFGSSVAISGDTVIVGAFLADVGGKINQGAAYVYTSSPAPVPVIASINPNSRGTGSGGFELVVTGSNFVSNSVVRFNGQDRATTFVSGTELRAQILAADVATVGAFPVTVFSPAPGGGSSNAVSFTVFNCSYALNPTAQSFTASGGTGTTNVVTASGCTWTATSNAAWIAITSGASGNGNGAVNFTVGFNTGPARTGTITVNGLTFTVTQANGCTYTVSPSSANIGAAGGTGSFNVTISNAACAWTAVTTSPWITINSGATGTGNGSVSFTVQANTSNPRTGTIDVNGQIFTINQVSGCVFTLSPTSASVPTGGGNGTFTVTAGAGCAWTAVSNDLWITITSSASGTSNGTVAYTVAANAGAARTGTISAGGQTFTITQATGCVFTLSSTSANIGANGGNGSVNVTTNASCAWTATSNVPWITVTTGGTGTGNGNVTFAVAANTGAARTGTLTIAGQTFTVTQGLGCNYSLSPTSTSFSSAGGTGGFNVVSSNAECTWTAATTDSWITINMGASGTGNGGVTFTVASNIGPERTGAINVNGQIFTVTQISGCTYSLSVAGSSVAATGGVGSFNINSAAQCAWTAVSNDSWITITSGASGNGSGSIGFAVAANTGAARTGTISVGGQTYTVSQAAGNAPGNSRARFDFDGDGKSDVSVFRPSDGVWYLLNSTSGFTSTQFGVSSDKLVPADFDGDGRTDIAVYRDGTWFLQRSRDGFTGIAFGAATDIPVPADFTGDGRAEIAVFRPSNGVWYTFNLVNNQVTSLQFGQAGDVPVQADYDGDGKADVAVYRSGTWFVQRSTQGFTGVAFGESTDKPVVGDYDGDGKSDIAVFRPSNGVWYLMQSTNGFTSTQFGLGTDLQAAADYDGDGRTDIAVYRSGTWFLQRSQAGFMGVAFGASTDKPTPNAFMP